MLIPIALFVGLLVATAIIAHVSDNLGKKLGKKRVSLFGLRPRTSATLATVGSSWLIMIFTLAVLLSVVTPLRNALFSYQSEIAQYKSQSQEYQLQIQQKQLEVQRKQSQIQQSQFKIVGLQRQAKTAEEQKKAAEEQKKAADEQKLEARKQTQVAQSNLQSARQGEQIAKRSAQAAQRTANVEQISARRAQEAAGIARAQKLTAQAQQLVAQKELGTAQNSLNLIQTRLNLSKMRLQASQKRLNEANLQLRRAEPEVISAYKQVATSYKQIAHAQRQVAQLQSQKAQLQIQVKGLAEYAKHYVDLSDYLSQSDIHLSVDQTLAERRVDATRLPEQIGRELRFMATTAHEEACHVFHNDKLEFYVGAAVADKSGTTVELDGDQAINLYSNALASANQAVSARLVSAFNYPSDTTSVIARFVFVPIRTIYIARENVAELTIDTTKSESSIFGQLQKLVDDARKNAVKRGASPPLSSDNPNFFDGDTGPKLFEALRAVQKFDHPVQVRVVAARDLDSAEPLQIRFAIGDDT